MYVVKRLSSFKKKATFVWIAGRKEQSLKSNYREGDLDRRGEMGDYTHPKPLFHHFQKVVLCHDSIKADLEQVSEKCAKIQQPLQLLENPLENAGLNTLERI